MQLEISLIISQILAFLIMLWILKKFAWKPLLKILNDRKEKIRSEFSLIEEQKKEIKELLDLYQTKLAKIDEEAKQKMDLAIESAQKTAQALQEEAHVKAKEILQKAQEGIKHEMQKAQEELKGELIKIVIQATQKLLGEKMDTEKDRRLIDAFIKKAELK